LIEEDREGDRPLGAAAYAQSAVLAAFMGGMAIGAWYAARWIGGTAETPAR
jgi:hypothetical protein